MWIMRRAARADGVDTAVRPIPAKPGALETRGGSSRLGGRQVRLPDLFRYDPRPRWEREAALGLRPRGTEVWLSRSRLRTALTGHAFFNSRLRKEGLSGLQIDAVR